MHSHPAQGTRLWVVEELRAVARGAARLALLFQIQQVCINRLVVRRLARNPCFAQKTRKMGSTTSFQGALFVTLSTLCSVPSNRVGLGCWEPILTHQPGPGVVRSRQPCEMGYISYLRVLR